MPIRIKHDVSAVSIVSTCSACPRVWWAFNVERDAAYASGENHLVNAHGWAPSDAAEQRRSRDRKKTSAANA